MYLVVILFIGCETATDTKIIVQNNSNKTISINAESNYDLDKIVHDIAAKKSKTLIYLTRRGGSDIAENPADYLSVFNITNAAGDSIQKKYKNTENWEIDISGSGIVSKSYVHTYTFIVNDSDF